MSDRSVSNFDWTRDEDALQMVVAHFTHGLVHLAANDPDLLGELIAGRAQLKWDHYGVYVQPADDGQELVVPSDWSSP